MWLSPPDPWKNHNVSCESQHKGTTTWWIHGETFSEWKYSGSSSLLWLHGKRYVISFRFGRFARTYYYHLHSGSREERPFVCWSFYPLCMESNVLSSPSSSIIQDIRGMCASGLALLAFFYCDFRDDQKRHRRGLLLSLLVQLCDQSDSCSAVLSIFYSAHGNGAQHPSDSELLQCLMEMLEIPGQPTVYIIIDALDECPKATNIPSPRERVVDLVEELVMSRLSNLRVCVTSRPEADIAFVLDPLVFRSISIHEERGQIRDITEYIKFVVNTDREMRRWKASDKGLVISTLTAKADGM